MGRFFKKMPKAGMPVSMIGFADGLSGIERALSEMNIANGHIQWSMNNVPTLILDSSFEDDGGTIQPWDVSFAAGVATFVECSYKRAVVTKFFSDQTFNMPNLTTCYVGYQYNMASGAVAIIAGAAKTDVTDATEDAVTEFDKTILYKCLRSSEGNWSVLVDYRNMPKAMVYL